MPRLIHLPLTLALALGAVAVAAAPAAAGPVGTCPGGEPVCVYIPAATIPVGIPVGPTTVLQPVTAVPLPRVCDSSGTNCVDSYLLLPGAYLNVPASTLATVAFPGLGVGINGTAVTLYASPPTVTPGTTPLGITASVSVAVLPVATSLGSPECNDMVPIAVGPLSIGTTACITTVTLTL